MTILLSAAINAPAFCGNCVYRNRSGICTNEKLSVWGKGGEDTSDMLRHDRAKGGVFLVGEKFGCVHHIAQRIFNRTGP